MRTKDNRRDAIHWGSLVSGVVWLTVFSLFAGKFVPALRSNRTPTDGWEKVPCLIQSAEVERRGVEDFAFTAEYAYFWNGLARRSSALDLPGQTEHRFWHLEERLPLLEKYAPGSQHVCLVDPGNGGAAALPVESPLGDGGDDASGWGFAVGFGAFVLLAVLAGVWQIAGAFPQMRRLDGGRVRKAAPAVCLALFGMPFAMVGAESLREGLAKRALYGGEMAAVRGKVLYSGVAVHSGRKTSYSASIGYEYVFRGKKYEGDRVGGLEGGFYSTTTSRPYRRIADSVKPGDAVKVWVLVSDPRRSCLRRETVPAVGVVDFVGAFLFLGVGLGCCGTGVLLLLAALRRGRDAAEGPPGQRVLRRLHTEVISLGLFAFFWNALAWSIAPLMLRNLWADRDPLLFVAAGFPLIGVGVAVGFGVALWRDLRAPKLSMALLSTGDSRRPALDWRLEDPSAVRSLAIRLEGLGNGYKGRTYTAVSVPVGKHAAPVPESWRESVSFPPNPGNVVKWRIVATGESGEGRRAFRVAFGVPEDVGPGAG